MKHTPGPWTYKDMNGYLINHPHKGMTSARVNGPIGGIVATAVAHNLDGQEVQANARLISAAPDLLEALVFVQKALADWRDGKEGTHHPVHGRLNLEEVKYNVVDLVIEKATGE